MRIIKKGQHIFLAFKNDESLLDSQMRPRIYTSLKNAEKFTPNIDKDETEYIEYAPLIAQQNEPLTIEQLKEMDGQPVWCKHLKDSNFGGKWLIVDCEMEKCSSGKWELPFEDIPDDKYGETWIAYRNPIKEEMKR